MDIKLKDKPLRCPRCFSSNVSNYDYEKSHYSRCFNCNNEFDIQDEKRDIFHQLWTRSTELPNYEERKKLWIRLALITGW